MNVKRFTIFTAVLAMMALFAGMVVSAQDDTVTGRHGGPGFGGRGFGGNSEVILEATGLTHEELHDALEDGSTIAELIEANDGDLESVIAELVAEQTDRINEKVEEERITQEQADEILAGLEEQITSRLNGTFEHPENFEGQGRRGGRRGGRGFGFDDNPNDTDTDTDTSETEELTPEDA